MAGGVSIGLSNIVYAKLTADTVDLEKATYEQPVRIPGAIAATVNPNTTEETLFADDGPYESATTLGAISLELNVVDLPLETQAELFGHKIVDGVLIRKSTDTPPWVAVGFKTLKSNGKYRYTWLAKGKFSLGEQSAETKGDAVNYQTPTATGAFVKRECDDEWERHIDEDMTEFDPTKASNWFNNPYGDAVAPA
jgi:phi13 family phage major tail protein